MLVNFILLAIFKIIISVPNCIEGINFCSKCNPFTNICIKCDSEVYIPDKKGGCVIPNKCIKNKNYCLKCDEDQNLCEICDYGYYPDSNGKCSYTNNCEISEKGKCLKCKDNYILIGEEDFFNQGIKLCKWIHSENFKNCELINTSNGSCKKCFEGHFLNEGDKKCSSTENCYESIFGVCSKCKIGYYLNKKENKCQKQEEQFIHCKESIDGLNCDICDDDFYFNENGICISVKFCAKESSELNKCEKCFSGYYLSGNKESCTNTNNCHIGNKDIGICIICKEGYYLDYKDGKCKSNQEDNEFKFCVKVDNNECVQCLFPNYYLSEDNKCSSTQNCEESHLGKCIRCKDKYFFDYDNNCIKIENCKYSNGVECLECIDNYYYDINNAKCILDQGIYKNCKRAYEGWFCQICKDDFYLNQTDHLCYSNKDYGKFYKCEKTEYNIDMDRCTSCKKGYYMGYKDNKCTNSNGCVLSDNENNCIECDDYHCLDMKNKSCEYNYKILNEEKKFYYRCKKTNEDGDRCEVCVDNFTLNENGLCVDYGDNCIEKNENICLRCKNDEEGHFCLNSVFGCVKKYFNKCLECNDYLDFEKCTKCYEGYKLNELNECVQT